MREGWIYKKLGEVCEVFDSMRKPVTKKDRKEGIYPYYGATGIQDYVDSYLFDGRYLLVGEDGAKWGANEGTAFIIDGKSWVNNHAHIIRLSSDVNDILVKYYLNFKDLSDYITGAVVPKLTQQALKNIQIPIPPITAQQQIVSELDLLNHIIDQKRQQLKEYDALAESIFYDMFGDPVENPNGWEVKTIGDLCRDVKYGTSKPAVEGGQYPYLRMNNITSDGHLDLKDLKKIDIPDEEFEKCVVRYGDILFNRTNSLEHVGKTCMFDLAEPMIIAGYIIRIRLIDSAEPLFVAKFFNMPSTKKVLRKMAKGAVNQANINSKEMQTIPIPLPPLTLQRQFAAKIESIEQQKQLLKESIKETEMLFQSRMDYWFNG